MSQPWNSHSLVFQKSDTVAPVTRQELHAQEQCVLRNFLPADVSQVNQVFVAFIRLHDRSSQVLQLALTLLPLARIRTVLSLALLPLALLPLTLLPFVFLALGVQSSASGSHSRSLGSTLQLRSLCGSVGTGHGLCVVCRQLVGTATRTAWINCPGKLQPATCKLRVHPHYSDEVNH